MKVAMEKISKICKELFDPVSIFWGVWPALCVLGYASYYYFLK